jgi:hypothetical protein
MKTANKTVTAVRLVEDALRKAHEFEDYNIFTFIDDEGALERAREIDAKIAKIEANATVAPVVTETVATEVVAEPVVEEAVVVEEPVIVEEAVAVEEPVIVEEAEDKAVVAE